jgi:hypothetical protein
MEITMEETTTGTPTTFAAPAPGERWPGQGGIFICTLPAIGELPARHLIAHEDEHEGLRWGEYEDVPEARSRVDGKANTAALVARGAGKHPAAEWAAAQTADGHADFHLPSQADLFMASLYAPQHFNEDGWYWSSTQGSRSSALRPGLRRRQQRLVRQGQRVQGACRPHDSTLGLQPFNPSPAKPVRLFLTTQERAMRNPPLRTLPTFGEIVPGAGGRLGAIMRGALVDGVRQSDYAVIVADAVAGGEVLKLAWGNYGTEIPGAASRTDGLANTAAMVKANCPAALAVAGLQLEGFTDWYLPARGEMWGLCANVPELFAPEYHWTSTQGSRFTAFVQDVAGGGSYWGGKDNEFRVRAVRRIQLQHFTT